MKVLIALYCPYSQVSKVDILGVPFVLARITRGAPRWGLSELFLLPKQNHPYFCDSVNA